MVVKMSAGENAQKSSTAKQYVGNQQEINIQCNSTETTVIGNRNEINVDVNNGTVKVIGNHCTVRMNSGSGSVSYTGNHGRVFHGDGVREEQIVNVGRCFKLGGKERAAKTAGNGEKTQSFKTKIVHGNVRRIRVNCVDISFE